MKKGIKVCKCGVVFIRPKKMNYKEWGIRNYCSNKCKLKYYRPTTATKNKIRESNALEKSSRWKDGIEKNTPVLIKLLKRAKVNTNKCSVCHKKVKGYNRQIHHINKNRANYDINNLVVCCVNCHRNFHGTSTSIYTIYAKKYNVSYECARYKLNETCREQSKLRSKRQYQRKKDNIILNNQKV